MTEPFRRLIREDKSRIRAVLSELDRHTPAGRTGVSRRKYKRFNYRASDIPMVLVMPGGGVGRFLVSARNLSAGGMSFVHGCFVHPESRCRFMLVPSAGEKMTVGGVVRSCRLLSGRLHEVNVQFDARIDPERFCDPSAGASASIARERASRAAPLRGRGLVVSKDAGRTRLVGKLVSELGLQTSTASSLGAALDQVKRSPFDVVICEQDLCSPRGDGPTAALRAGGHERSIVLLYHSADPAVAGAARAAGADAAVGAPFDTATLASAISEVIKPTSSPSVLDQPIVSNLGPGAAEQVERYLAELRRSAMEISAALDGSQTDALTRICRKLSGSCPIYGFPQIADAARRARELADASIDIDETRQAVEALVDMCLRARAVDNPAA